MSDRDRYRGRLNRTEADPDPDDSRASTTGGDRETLEFLFEEVSLVLHCASGGGASELRASKFDERCRRYQAENPITIGAEDVGELIAAATMPMAEEIGRLRKKVAELERATGALEEEEFQREITRIEEQVDDDGTRGSDL